MNEQEKQFNMNEEEMLSDDELEQVAGGAGLKQTIKVKTVDISEDTKSKI